MTPIFVCLKPRHGNHENIAAVTVYIWTLMISAQSLFQIPEDKFTVFQAVFSAIFFLVLLVFFAQALFTHFNLTFTIVLAVCALCFGGILVLSIKNLKRFDRK